MPDPFKVFTPDTPGREPTGKPKQRRRKLPSFLRWPDALKLLNWCDAEVFRTSYTAHEKAARDAMIIRVGLYLGLRVSEICALELRHIDLEHRSCFVENGKGCKDRYVRIPEKMIEPLILWIGDRKSGWLFEKKGQRLFERSVRWRITRAARLAGTPVHVHPHVLRHTYATHFLEMGGNIRSLQALLGHAELTSTSRYLDVDVSRFAEDVDRL